ncbi:MAG TPA: FHA domain-containing protein [Victivallales bacterium]|nr:FHA domain-containing protein [Victivallales bacterium]HPO90119.1 FHA domain-containing protein [Victivallales bacterium]HRR28171.1 FHA domain-containing protein [Victivallales bacterium]HRU01783.1 FHA domain-containing protein [Victivallales bacterium]
MAGTPRLIVLSEQFRGKTIELTEDVYTCGRTEANQIFLKDPTVSSKHCEFVKKGNTYIVRDLNSTNGTRVNNIPITEQELQNSDIVQVGGIEILYDCEDKSLTTAIKTQTGINLDGAQVGVSTVKKMENFDPFAQNKKSGKTQKITIAVVVILVLLILVLIGVLLMMLFKGNKEDNANLMLYKDVYIQSS